MLLPRQKSDLGLSRPGSNPSSVPTPLPPFLSFWHPTYKIQMIPTYPRDGTEDEIRECRPRNQHDAWHLVCTQQLQLLQLLCSGAWSSEGKVGVGGKHKATYMGTWVPAEVALSREDVASMNIVT